MQRKVRRKGRVGGRGSQVRTKGSREQGNAEARKVWK